MLMTCVHTATIAQTLAGDNTNAQGWSLLLGPARNDHFLPARLGVPVLLHLLLLVQPSGETC